MQIYLDSAATTPLDKKVISRMNKAFKENYGNASSMHKKGKQAKDLLENARKTIAKTIHALPEEIYFTSGGTEANNLAIRGILATTKKKEIIISSIEHASILSLCKQLEKEGYTIHYISVDQEGFINVAEIKKKINSNTALVSIMYVNNEIGTIQNIENIGKICQDDHVPFHTDAVQAYKKIPLDMKKQKVTLATISSHKIYGPKGVAALYVRKGTILKPLLYGGDQEQALRPGTENIPAIVGFAEASQLHFPSKKIEQKKKYLIKNIKKEISEVRINGSVKNAVPTILNICIEGIEGDVLVKHLSEKGIYISTGSACHSTSIEPSHVLKALGLSDEDARASIRISLTKDTTKKELVQTIKHLKSIVSILRKL